VFHPAYRWVEDAEDAQSLAPTCGRMIPGTNRAVIVHGREVRWAEVAEANGRVAHPAMEWASITGDQSFRWGGEQPGLWDETPEMGTLPLRHTERLCELLAGYTTTPERCWFAIWEGHGYNEALQNLNVPRLAMPGRAMIMLTGPLSALPCTSFGDPTWYTPGWVNKADWYRSPSLWWPEDRSWCVASDVDLSTYLGASAACVERLLEDDHLEVLPVDPGTKRRNGRGHDKP